MESYFISDASGFPYYYSTSDECMGRGWNLTQATDVEIQSLLYPAFTWVMLYLQSSVAFVGIVCNLAFMFIVCKVPYMRSSMNIILLNLSVADLLFLFVGTVVKLVSVMNSPVLGDSLYIGHICQCLIINCLMNAVSFTSLLLVSLISVERYVAVCMPLQYLKVTGRQRTWLYVTSVWTFSCTLAILLVPSRLDFSIFCVKWPYTPPYANFPAKVGFCDTKSDFWISLDECLQIFPFFIALTLNVVCFAKIIVTLYSRMAPSSQPIPKQLNDKMENGRRSATHNATKMLLINGIAFFILATPFHMTNAIQFIENIASNWSCDCSEFKSLSVLFLYINSAVNPLIYGITNVTYRRAYYSVFWPRRNRSLRRQSTITTSDNLRVRKTTNI